VLKLCSDCCTSEFSCLYWVAHKNVPNSNDHDSKTKAPFSMQLGNLILICVCMQLVTSLLECTFIAVFEIVNLHYSLLNKHSFNSNKFF